MIPLESLFTVPPAIESVLNVVEKLSNSKGARNADIMKELQNVAVHVQDIRQAMVDFSYITVDLKPWKHAHHSTNQVILKEMAVLFKMPRAYFETIRTNPPLIELELDKSQNDEASAKYYILAKDEPELDLELPKHLVRLTSNRSWHLFILNTIEELRNQFDKRDVNGFYVTLDNYRSFVQGLNQAADNNLLRGLDKITDRLDDLRRRLSKNQA